MTTNLSQTQIAKLEARIKGDAPYKRAATKAKQIEKFKSTAFEKGLSDEFVQSVLESSDFDAAEYMIKAMSRDPIKPRKPKLEEMSVHGLGTSEATAKCPHCSINHMDNGYMIHEPKGEKHEKCTSRIYACLGCGEEFGPKIRRNNTNGSVSPHRGSKVFISKDAANPYRAKTQSHAAFEFLQKNPNTKFEDLQALGVRIRTVTEMLRKGIARKAQ